MKIKIELNLLQIFTIISFLLLISITLAQQLSSSSYKMPREAITSGGGNISSSNYFMEPVIESTAGNSSSSSYNVCVGFGCCPADVKVTYVNSSSNSATNRSTINYTLWQADICMGTTNVTVQCSANCDPCTQSCSIETSRYTLSLTDSLAGSTTVNITNANSTNVVYCRVTDDDFVTVPTCFNSPTNLTVTVEAGGPYSGTATVLIVGNTTYSDGTAVSDVQVTLDIYDTDDLTTKVTSTSLQSNSNGKYSATFSSLSVGSYRVNATASYGSARANATDTFDLITPLANCQIKTIALSGKAVDATTGLTITSGTASVIVEETGDRKDGVTISNGGWSTSIVTCVVSGNRYTLSVRITDNAGKTSWTQSTIYVP